MQIAEIGLEQIEPNPVNIRDEVPDDDAQLLRLADDVSTVGVKTPLVIYPHPDRDGAYVLQDGHNRRHAAMLAGLESVPCVVVDRPRRGEREDLETMYTTGRNHRLLNVLEESRALQRMLDLGMDVTTIGKKFKQPRSQVKAKARITEGDERVRESYGYGQLNLENVMELQKLEDAGQTDVLEKVLSAHQDYPHWNVSSLIERMKIEVEKDQLVETVASSGAVEAPEDARWSGKYEVVDDEMTTEEHIAAGHEFQVAHYGQEAETRWVAPRKKAATGLTEEQKAAKRHTKEVNAGLAIAFRTRRKHLVERVQDVNHGDSAKDKDLLFQLLWPDISRIDEHLLGEITLIPFPTDKVNDCTWDERRQWLAKVEKRISGYSWRQLTRLKAIKEGYDTDKQMRRTEGFDLENWQWHQRVEWIRQLREHFGYEFTDAEKTAITDWQDANWEAVLQDDRKRIEV